MGAERKERVQGRKMCVGLSEEMWRREGRTRVKEGKYIRRKRRMWRCGWRVSVIEKQCLCKRSVETISEKV